MAKSSALIHLKRYQDAEDTLKSLKESFKNNKRALSYAFDNTGWLLSNRRNRVTKDSLQEELALYETALDHEERFITYVNEIQCLLELSRVKAAEQEFLKCLKKFPRAIIAFREQVKLQGADFVKNLAKSDLLNTLVFTNEDNNS